MPWLLSAESKEDLIALTPGDVHLWLAYHDHAIDERRYSACRDLLTPAEREQQQRFYFARDRVQYLLTRVLVRTVLSRYAPVLPQEWAFTPNRYGRPEIANPPVQDLGLTFNLSHTHGLIVLGVGRRAALGVDTENTVRREPSIDIADRYFAPAEVAALAALESAGKHDRFFEYWTLKEAYIKARGMGLSLPLDKFAFRYAGDGRLTLSLEAEMEDDPARWRIWLFRPTGDFLVAVCAERSEARPASLLVRELTLGGEPRVLVPTFLRTSG